MKNKNTIITIELNDSHLKIIRSTLIKGKRAIDLFKVVKMKDVSDSEVVKAFNQVMIAHNLSLDDAVFIIPRKFSILKKIDLPSQNDEEIRKMIEMQLVNQLPYSLDDVTFDYQVIERDREGYSHVLVFVLHNEVNSRYAQLLGRVGISPENMTISSFGVWGWVNYQEEKALISTDQAVAIVDVGVESSEICFFHKGQLLFSRNLMSGASDLNAEGSDGLIKQIELSLRAYTNENLGPPLQRIIFLSTISSLTAKSSELQRDLGLSAQFVSPLENVLCKKNVDLSNFEGMAGISLTVSLGIHLSEAKKKINLTPRDVIDSKVLRQLKGQWLQLGLTGLLLILLVGGIFGVRAYKQKVVLEELIQEEGLLKKKVSATQEKSSFVDAFEKELGQRIFIPEIMRELFVLVPEGLSLRSVSLSEAKVLTLQGYAVEESGVNDFQNSLVGAKIFTDVNLLFATKRKTYNMDVTDFKISLDIFSSAGGSR